MAEKETIEVKVNESEEVAQVIEDLWDTYAKLDIQKDRYPVGKRSEVVLLWTRLHRLERALGLKE